MKKHLKINQFSSNKAVYSQAIIKNKVISSKKNNVSNLSHDSEVLMIPRDIFIEETVSLYNNNKIKFNTLKYILLLFKIKDKSIDIKRNNANQLNIEYSIESGLY